MTTPKRDSAAKKKKRLVQLRDAQRRRRERLKDDSQHFVQIILSDNVLLQLRKMVRDSGETLQHIIGRLVEESIERIPVARVALPIGDVPEAPSYLMSLDGTPHPSQTEVLRDDNSEVAEGSGASDGVKPVNQLDLFG